MRYYGIVKGKMTTSTYSKDLRKKVINYLNKGKSQKEASEVFGVHRNTISRWINRCKKEGNYAAKKGFVAITLRGRVIAKQHEFNAWA